MTSKIEEVRDAMMAAFDAAPDGEDVSMAMARAAIKAMREPTEAMDRAGQSGRYQKYGGVKTTWTAMIDAALQEEGE